MHKSTTCEALQCSGPSHEIVEAHTGVPEATALTSVFTAPLLPKTQDPDRFHP